MAKNFSFKNSKEMIHTKNYIPICLAMDDNKVQII